MVISRIILLLMILMSPFVLSLGVDIPVPVPIFDNNTAFVNSSANWITISFGALNNANLTQFFSNAGELNILESYLESFGDGEWLNLSGGNANQNINIGVFDFTTTGNLNGRDITATDTQPDIMVDITDVTKFGRFIFKENGLTFANVQALGTAFGDPEREKSIEFFTHSIRGNNIIFKPGGVKKLLIRKGGNVEVTGNLQLNTDGDILFFGTSQDAGISYNNNLLINPKVVDSGLVNILGELLVDENISVLGNITTEYIFVNKDLNVTGNVSLKFGDLISEQNPDVVNAIRIKATSSDVDVILGDLTGYFSIWNVADDTAVFFVNNVGNTDLLGDLTIGGRMIFAFGEIIDNLVDGWLTITGSLNVTGNITSLNVFIPQYENAHTNFTIPVLGSGTWTNITIAQEDSAISFGITHTHNDATNQSFTFTTDGVYEINYNLDIEDTSVGATNIDVAGRVIYVNGTEIIGSVFEIDVTKQATEFELSHDFSAHIKSGETIIFQFIGDNANIQISTHGTFGDHPTSASIKINKIANLPI